MNDPKTPSALAQTVRATALFARLTFRQLVRGRVAQVGALCAACGLGMAALASQGAVTGRSRIVADVCLGAAYLTCCGVAVAATVGLAVAEDAGRLVYPWLARPVPRASYVVGRFLGLWAALTLLVGALGLSGAATAATFGGALPAGYAAAAAMQAIEVAVLLGVSLLLTQLCAPPLAAAAALVALAAGNAGPELLALARGEDVDAVTAAVARAVHVALPDFHALSLRGFAAADVAPPVAHVATAAAYGCAYACGCVALAALVYRRRQSL